MLSPHLGLLMPLTNSVKAGKNAYKKPKMEESVLGFLYAFLPALTELVTGIRRPKCGLSTYSAPTWVFSVPN